MGLGNDTSGFVQQFSIGVAGEYELTWYDNAATFYQTAPYQMSVSGGPGAFAQTYDANQGVDATWNERVVQLSLGVGIYTISFVPLEFKQDRMIDSLSLVAAVPVPAAFWLLGSALAGLGGLMRRSHRAA